MSGPDKPAATIKFLPDDTIQVLTAEKKETSFWEKPHGAVILAFLLTSVLGGTAAACYQTQQWYWQQEYSNKAEVAKRRAEVTKEVLQRVSEAFTLNNHVVNLTVFGGVGTAGSARDAQLAETVKGWFPQSRDWQVNDKILVADTEANFSQPGIHCLLAAIIRNRADLVRDVRAFIETSNGAAVDQNDTRFGELEKLGQRIYLNVRATTGSGGLLSRLSEQMIDEMRSDTVSESWWRPWARGHTRTAATERMEMQMAQAVDKYLCAMRTGTADALPLASGVVLTLPQTLELRRDLPEKLNQVRTWRYGETAVRDYLRSIASGIAEVRIDRPPIIAGNYARVVYDIVLKSGEVLPSCDCLRFMADKIVEVHPYFDPQATGGPR
jgi:hypothetical protein